MSKPEAKSWQVFFATFFPKTQVFQITPTFAFVCVRASVQDYHYNGRKNRHD